MYLCLYVYTCIELSVPTFHIFMYLSLCLLAIQQQYSTSTWACQRCIYLVHFFYVCMYVSCYVVMHIRSSSTRLWHPSRCTRTYSAGTAATGAPPTTEMADRLVRASMPCPRRSPRSWTARSPPIPPPKTYALSGIAKNRREQQARESCGCDNLTEHSQYICASRFQEFISYYLLCSNNSE